jgi:hypothetical protein
MYFYFKRTREAMKLFPQGPAECWIGYAISHWEVLLEMILLPLVIALTILLFCKS